MGIAVMDIPTRPAPTTNAGPKGVTVALELTGATTRQVNYWAAHGLLGERLRGMGSGGRRVFEPRDLEIVHALAWLASLGCRGDELAIAAETLRHGPRVDPAGERYVVPLRGRPYRLPAGAPVSARGPLWVVDIRAFTEADQIAAAS